MKKIICNHSAHIHFVVRAIVLALVLGCFTWTGFAQGGFSYIFPGITTNNNITIGNINPQPTTVTVSFYLSTGLLNSLSVDLQAGTQTRVNPNSVGLSTFTGSVVVSSPVQLAVSADQFEGSTAFDFMYPSQLAPSLVIPFMPADQATVAVNIFNPGPNQAEVKVALVQSSGAHTTTKTATLDPLHTTTISLSAQASVQYAIVTTENVLRPITPVAANAEISTFNTGVTGAVPRTDFALVPAIPSTQFTTTANIPFFAEGPDYFSLIQIENLSGVQQTLQVSAKQANGTPFSGTNNPASIVLPPYGSIRQEMAIMLGSTTASFATGTITVTSQGTLATNGNPTGGAPALLAASVGIGNLIEPSFAVIPQSPLQTTFALQLRGTDRSFFTGMSFTNPSTSADAHVTMTFILDQGTTISSVPLTVPHSQQVIGTLAQLFPEAVGNGFILVSSDQPISFSGMDGRSDNSALSTRNTVYASSAFVPAPQSSFLITGTVLDQNAGINGQNIGVPNVALALSGPIEVTTATDLAGTYTFNQLPPGQYTVTPLPIGFVPFPSSTTATITNTNSHNNNFGIGLTPATIVTINPASALLASSTPSNANPLSIQIQGTNFIPPTTFTGNIFTGNINKFTTGTVFVFADNQVPTTVSSPTFLTASVSQSLLVTTGTVQVVVRNLGPSGDFVDSAPFDFLIGTTPPMLTTVTGVPSPVIAGQVTAPFQITINGSGFTPATLVRVNFHNRPTTYVNQNQVIGTVLPSDLTIPGSVPVTVQNPNTVDSTPFQLPVLYPIPAITGISPSSITAPVQLNAQPVAVTVMGTNFSQSPTNPLNFAQVNVNGTAVPTQYISTTQIVGLIPPNLVSVPGVLQISVSNPMPNLAPSNAAPLFVTNPGATITSVSAGNATWNPNAPPFTFYNQPVVITGTNFSPSAVVWYNSPCDSLGLRQALSTVRNSETQIVGTIVIMCAGNYTIQVANPQPGGGLSNAATVNVPSVTSSERAPTVPSHIIIGPSRIIERRDPPSVSNPMPKSVSKPVPNSVSNPKPDLAPSNAAPMFVTNPGATITSVSAGNASWNPNSSPFNQPVVITGTNFSPSAVVWYNSPCDSLGLRQALSTVRNSETEIAGTIVIMCAGNYTIQVTNPQLGGGLSNAATVNVPSVTIDPSRIIEKREPMDERE